MTTIGLTRKTNKKVVIRQEPRKENVFYYKCIVYLEMKLFQRIIKNFMTFVIVYLGSKYQQALDQFLSTLSSTPTQATQRAYQHQHQQHKRHINTNTSNTKGISAPTLTTQRTYQHPQHKRHINTNTTEVISTPTTQKAYSTKSTSLWKETHQ